MKRIILILISVLAALSLNACSDKGGNDSTDTQSAQASLLEAENFANVSDTDTDVDYSKYTESNEEYDEDGNVVKSNVYDAEGKLASYRKYTYNSDGKMLSVTTYDINDLVKSEIICEYSKENDKNITWFTLSDAEGKPLFKNYIESEIDSDGVEHKVLDKYIDGNDELMCYVVYSYNDSYEEESAAFYDADDNIINDESAALEIIENLEKSICPYLY